MNGWSQIAPLLPDMVDILLHGALTTIEITLASFIVAVAIGLPCAVVASFPAPAPRTAIRLYVNLFRGIPVLTQLFILYFGLAQLGLKLDAFTVAVIGFGMNGGAYLSEVFRAGLQSIDIGQTEAAFMVGMTRVAALRYVVLPQAMRVSVPSTANYAVGLLKDTALASAVAAPELSFYANNLVTRTYQSGLIYSLVALIYIAMSLPLIFLARQLEARASRGRQP